MPLGMFATTPERRRRLTRALARCVRELLEAEERRNQNATAAGVEPAAVEEVADDARRPRAAES